MSTPAEAVGANLKRLRAPLSLRRLAQRLREIGHPICADGLNRMEMGRRQATVGDLVALAVVLDVSPATLLMPAERGPVQLTPGVRATWDAAWRWVTGDQPLVREALINPERVA